MTGSFSGNTMQIGSFSLSNVGGIENLYVARIDSSGNAIWAVSATSHFVTSNAVCLDGNGNVAIAGYFQSTTLSFGSINLTNFSTTGTTTRVCCETG